MGQCHITGGTGRERGQLPEYGRVTPNGRARCDIVGPIGPCIDPLAASRRVADVLDGYDRGEIAALSELCAPKMGNPASLIMTNDTLVTVAFTLKNFTITATAGRVSETAVLIVQ